MKILAITRFWNNVMHHTALRYNFYDISVFKNCLKRFIMKILYIYHRE